MVSKGPAISAQRDTHGYGFAAGAPLHSAPVVRNPKSFPDSPDSVCIQALTGPSVLKP